MQRSQLSTPYSSPLNFVAPCGAGLLVGMAALVFSPLWVLIGIVVACTMVPIILKWPEIGLLGVLILSSTILPNQASPEASLLRIPVGIGHVYIPDILLLGLMGSIIIRVLVAPDFKIIRTPLDLPLLAFYAIIMLSTLNAILQSSVTFNNSLGEVRQISGYLTFFLVTNLVRKDHQIRTLWRGMLVLSMIVAAAMMAQYLLGLSTPILPGRVEPLDTEGLAFMDVTRINPPGESLVFTAFLALTAILVIDKLQLKKMWIIPVWCLTGLGVVLTFRRHLWIAVVIAFFLLAILCWRRVSLRMLGGVLVVISIATISLLQVNNQPKSAMNKLVTVAFERLDSLTRPQTFENPDSSLRWRDFEYKFAIPKIASNPLIGLGLGTTYRPWVIGKDWVGRDEEGFDGRNFLHNGHLSIIVKSGLLGYLSFLVFSLIVLVRGFKLWRRIPNPKLQAILLGFTLAYLGMLIGSIVNPIIMKGNWTPVIGFIIGINEVILTKVITKPMGMAA